MWVIYMLVPFSLVFLAGAIWAVRFAVRSHQFEDLDKAAYQVILDDRLAQRDASKPDAKPPTDTPTSS